MKIIWPVYFFICMGSMILGAFVGNADAQKMGGTLLFLGAVAWFTKRFLFEK